MRRLVLATVMVVGCALPALAQQQRVDPNTGNYVDVPDRFTQDWPSVSPDEVNPNSMTKSVSRRVSNESVAAVKSGGRPVVSPNQSAQLQSMGGMGTYHQNGDGDSNVGAKPDWWPQ